MKHTRPATITSAYHCTRPHCTRRTGYEARRVTIATPFTSRPSIIHLSQSTDSVPLMRVVHPAPFTAPSITLASNLLAASPRPIVPRRTDPTFLRPVKIQSYISSTYHLRKSVL